MPGINRVVMQKTSCRWLRGLDLENMDAAEISGKHGRRYTFKSYKIFRYPKHDICAGPFTNTRGNILQYDIILANQVWEHLDRPYAATCNVLDMLRPGGISGSRCRFSFPIMARRWTIRAGPRAGKKTFWSKRVLQRTISAPNNGAIAPRHSAISSCPGHHLMTR